VPEVDSRRVRAAVDAANRRRAALWWPAWRYALLRREALPAGPGRKAGAGGFLVPCRYALHR